jgi:hypothetical protein
MRKHWLLATAISLAAGVAFAKLPPPTPEQAQEAAAKKEQEQAKLEKEKMLLERAQDRVVEYYKRTKGAAGASAARGGTTESTNIPRKAVEPPRTAGPQGGKEQSAEAHSTPAK